MISYEMTTRLLKDILPVGHSLNASTVRNHLCQWRSVLTLRLKLIQVFFPAAPDWGTWPGKPLVVGIDGGYVRDRDDKSVILKLLPGSLFPLVRLLTPAASVLFRRMTVIRNAGS